jgi:hypothetical protein
MDKFPEVADLELEKLRQEITALKEKLIKSEELLKKHNIIESVSIVSDAEQIALDQLTRLKRVSDSGLTFDMETVKIFEIVVKTLMLAKGKTPPPEDKKKKEPVKDIGKLLELAIKK